MGSVDLYCERVGPGFWDETVNALTNLVFVIAAWSAWRLTSGRPGTPHGIGVLLVTSVAIGTGSFLFHTLATPWARLLDILPILFFQLAFLWLYGRQVIGLHRTIMAVALMAYLVASIGGRQFPEILNGSLIYAPTFLAILGLGIYHANSSSPSQFDILAAAAILALALLFRSTDNLVCGAFPIGTHFLWHVLNDVVVYLAARALILHRSERVR